MEVTIPVSHAPAILPPGRCRLPDLVVGIALSVWVGVVQAAIGTDREALIYPASDHRLQLDYGRATGANEDLYGEYSVAVGSGFLRFGLGLSEVDTDEGELFTRTFMFGGEGMLTDLLAIDLSYRSWGDPGDLTSDTFAVAAKWYGERIITTVEGTLRRITFFTFLDDPRDDRISGTGNGIRFALSYMGPAGWDLAVELSLYEYSLDMRQFDQRLQDTLLTNRALELSGSFLDNGTLLEVGYNARSGLRTALGWEYSTSAIDGMTSNALTLQWQYAAVSGQTLGLLLGRSESADGYGSNFGRLSLGYRW